MYEIGKTDDNPDVKELAFLIHPKFKECVTDFTDILKQND